MVLTIITIGLIITLIIWNIIVIKKKMSDDLGRSIARHFNSLDRETISNRTKEILDILNNTKK